MLKTAFFDTHAFEREVFDRENKAKHEIIYFDSRLTAATAVLAQGFQCVCAFANDKLDAPTLSLLAKGGTRLVALRSAGYNHVDLAAAKSNGIKVVRVPAYSPHSVAEHAVCLLLALNRKIFRAHDRVREMNFSLEGLVGFDLFGKVVGVVGTGKIGSVFAQILLGFGSRVVAYDKSPNPELEKRGVVFKSLEGLLAEADIVSLHVPLCPETKHLINADSIARMKTGAYLINTGRGGLVDSGAVLAALKSKKLGAVGLDVYEEEESVFFKDLSGVGIEDDVLARLISFPNVLITSHQGFLTAEALTAIAKTTLSNIEAFSENRFLENEVVS